MNKVVKIIATTILTTLVGLAVVAIVSGIKNKIKEDDGYDKVHPTYERGTLNVLDGKPEDSKQSFYTKKSIKATSVLIEVDFTARMSYQLFWYDENDYLIGVTETYNGKNTFDAEEKAVSFRLLVTPDLSKEDKEELTLLDPLIYGSKIVVKVKNVNYKTLTIASSFSYADSSIVYYEPGMTWSNWLSSDYALEDFYINDNGYVVRRTTGNSIGYISVYKNGTGVNADDMIDSSSSVKYDFR